MADDVAIELGDEGQTVDDRAVGSQTAQELPLHRLPSPLGHAEGRVVELFGGQDVRGGLTADDQVVAHQYRSVIQWLLPERKAVR